MHIAIDDRKVDVASVGRLGACLDNGGHLVPPAEV
jgi:hypothetical protein